ncbi:MAG: GMC oxidoreductase [Bacteroidota bacterium]
MSKVYDVIIVGSGPSGAQAAQTLVEAEVNVLMLDVGEKDEKYAPIVPNVPFDEFRQNDNEQYRYLLGDEFEAIPFDDIKTGSQLTPPRKHIMRNIEKLIPLESDTFFPMESLAYGGLGCGWGGGAFVYSDEELQKAGLDVGKIKEAYQIVGDRIGISGDAGSTKKYSVGELKNVQPSLKMDNSIEKIYSRYLKHQAKYNQKGVFIGPPPMAMLSQDLGERKKTEYYDNDFYTDILQQTYRPWITINNLNKSSNYTYQAQRLVLRFIEKEDFVDVETKNTISNEIEYFKTKKLILATGAPGTARIVLRSLSDKIQRLPLLSNPYNYIPCIYPAMLGKPLSKLKTSVAQAVIYLDETGKNEDVLVSSIFTYRSLLLYKLIKETPLNFCDGRMMMQYLQSAFVIAGLHFPDSFSESKYYELTKDSNSFTGDKLKAHYVQTEEEKLYYKRKLKSFKKTLNSFYIYPVKIINPGFGSSIHYAGSVPFSLEEKPGTLSQTGRIHTTKNVYIADGSGFTFLPAKGITFSIMANAHCVANEVLKNN